MRVPARHSVGLCPTGPSNQLLEGRSPCSLVATDAHDRLALITLRNRSEGGLGLSSVLSAVPNSLPALLGLLASLPGLLLSLPSMLMSAKDSFQASRGAKYGRLPADAEDELDLGEDELMDEAEELRDDDVYDDDLNTLPPSHSTPQRNGGLGGPPGGPPPAFEGSLLGEEFTSPHSVKKGD